ncbi:hypothetical protein ABIA27_004458 [Sinorhizobium fredii]
MVEPGVGDLPVMRLPCRQAEPDRETLRPPKLDRFPPCKSAAVCDIAICFPYCMRTHIGENLSVAGVPRSEGVL